MTKIHPYDIFDLICATPMPAVKDLGYTEEPITLHDGQIYMSKCSLLEIDGVVYMETASVPCKPTASLAAQ